MGARARIWGLPLFVATSIASAADVSVTGRFGNYSAAFLEDKKVRHHRYELYLRQDAKVSSSLTTVMAGRLRFDTALYPDSAAPRDYGRQVRRDEMNEAEARLAYLDYLGDSITLKLGFQQIDWIESLSPRTSDVITALDLRHAGYGNASDIIEPIFALMLGHSVGVGSVEWLVVPKSTSHRLPKAANGYGFYENLQLAVGQQNLRIKSGSAPDNPTEAEIGARFMTELFGFETTALAYHGHQRSPALRLFQRPTGSADLYETHPQVNTFGVFATTSSDAAVWRFLVLHEPKRRPSFFVAEAIVQPPPSAPPSAPVLVSARETYEERTRVGFGFDYVFSKDLKIYSESYVTRTATSYRGDDQEFSDEIEEPRKDTYTVSARFTNETITDLFASLDITLVGPDRGHSLSPRLTWTFRQDYKLALGANLVRSFSERSALEMTKDTSSVFVSIDGYFDARESE